jgi:hypothetical protein
VYVETEGDREDLDENDDGEEEEEDGCEFNSLFGI